MDQDNETMIVATENIEKKEDVTTTEAATISKRQQKRQAKEAKWLAGKIERRKKDREKKKLKRARIAKELGVDGLPKAKKYFMEMKRSKCKVSVVIDCDYDEFMNESEIKKLVKQLNRCYSLNRNSRQPVQLYITSVTGRLKDLMVKNQSGYINWDAHVTEAHWTKVFEDEENKSLGTRQIAGKIMYLTADSDQIVPDCDKIREANDYIFIIGGLIDHNRHKGLALERARKFNVLHGQLPIGEHIKMVQRKVLSIPHVFEIMQLASFSEGGHRGKAWKQIFETAIPARKIGKEEGESTQNA